MIVSKITARGQITLPKKVREFLKVGISDRVHFTLLENGKVLLSSEETPVTAFFGMLKHRKPDKPVTLEEMDAAIRQRRRHRASE